VEVDDTGLDIFGEHAIRAEDVGPLVLGPPTRVWDEGAGLPQSPHSASLIAHTRTRRD
jgi:hypothetical protein